jgi:hypothetical protein
MGAITGTLVSLGGSAMSGDGEKIVQVTCVPSSASDTITLTKATHGIASIAGIISAELTAGIDANLQTCSATASGLVITLLTYEGDGTAATDWTSAAARITVLGKM